MNKYIITKFIAIAFVASITMLLSFGVGQVGLGVGQEVLGVGQVSLGVGQALAYFSDDENSNNNGFEAGIIDFTLRSDQGNFVPPGEMNPGDSVVRDIYVTKIDESNPFKYVARSEPIPGSCDIELYNALELKIWYNWYDLGGVKHSELKYIGPIKDFDDFDTNPEDLDLRIYNSHTYYPNAFYAENEHWLLFEVTLPPDFVINPNEQMTCAVDFVFDGWQTRHDYVVPLSGFNDTERISSSFTAKHCTVWRAKINKVYYDVDAGHGTEPANEWIELYNDSDLPIDIMDWTIENSSSSDIISNSALIIPSYGYALITGNASTWGYWDNIPNDVVKIVLPDGAIGTGLNNDADMLILRDNNGNIVDQMNWGIPDLLWPNYNSGIWNPGCLDVDEGRALGRDPNGYDTDQPSDFIEFGFPEIKEIRVYQDGDLVVDMNDWYHMLWGNEPATIQWTVENPSGPHSDISIDILYIEDTYPAVIGNKEIDPFDSVSDIALNLPNPSSGEGSYYWDNVPHFLGHVWFKIVAVNNKNFMFGNTALTYRVFEPIRGEYTMEEILELMAAIGADSSELADAEGKLSTSFSEPIELKVPLESNEPIEPAVEPVEPLETVEPLEIVLPTNEPAESPSGNQASEPTPVVEPETELPITPITPIIPDTPDLPADEPEPIVEPEPVEPTEPVEPAEAVEPVEAVEAPVEAPVEEAPMEELPMDEPVSEPTVAPEPEPVSEPTVAPEPEPVSEPTVAPESVVEPELTPEPAPEPVVELEPTPTE